MSESKGAESNRTAVITGTTGFIGYHLAKRLLSDGWKVSVIVRATSDTRLLDVLPEQPDIYRFDGTVDSIMKAFDETGDALVFHLASLILPDHKPEDIEPLISSNILFGTMLVEAMVSKGMYRLINTGSYAQHYQNKEYSPATLYAATKQAFDAILKYYYEATPLRVITLKPFNVYGVGDPKPRLFALFQKASKEQIELDMSPGEQLVDLVYIDDVVDAFVMAAERFGLGGVGDYEEYAVSSCAPVRLKDIADTYSYVTGRPLKINWGGRQYRIREIMVPWNTGTLLPGWQPKISLEEGIRRMEQESRY